MNGPRSILAPYFCGLVALLALGLSTPTSAGAATRTFEATIAVPAAEAGPELIFGACPGPGNFDGRTYAFFDLGGSYKSLKSYGPPHLFDEREPVGIHHINDYDIDMYAFDAHCRDVTPSWGVNGPEGTEKFETKRRAARYVYVAYWSGIHPNLPVTLEVSHPEKGSR